MPLDYSPAAGPQIVRLAVTGPGSSSDPRVADLGNTHKEVNVAFRVLFLAHAPDADGERDRSVIDTGMYRLFTVVVRDQAKALEVCEDYVTRENIDSVVLCPGFTHNDVAEIARLAGRDVAVCVARGDGPGGRASREARERAGYLTKGTRS